MVLLTDIKGKKRKVTKADQKKIENYQRLPGVYVKISDILKQVQGDKTIPWKQQKGL